MSRRERRVKRAHMLSDVDGVLHGRVVETHKSFGFLKPEHPLRPPYNKKKYLYFPMPCQVHYEFRPGDRTPVVYILDKDAHEAPKAAEVVFPGVDYDPNHKLPYKRDKCGHICFQVMGKPQLDLCTKRCTKSFSCGCLCARKCSQPCKLTCQCSSDNTTLERLEIQAAHSTSNEVLRYWLSPERPLCGNDPKDLNYRVAESHFYRLAMKRGKQYKITIIEYVINPVLVRRFRAKRSEFQRKYGELEAKEVLAFHGSADKNIKNIMKENFKHECCQRMKFGNGIYLSEYPDVSLLYGTSLLLCKVLPGRSYDVRRSRASSTSPDVADKPLKPGYNSHRVDADAKGYGLALVIPDVDQILPCYLINYEEVHQDIQGAQQPSPQLSQLVRTQPAPKPSRPAPMLTRPAPQPSRLAPKLSQPVPQSTRPAPQPSRTTPQPSRTTPQPSQLAPQLPRPSPQPSRPAPQPSRLAPKPSRPAPQPPRQAPQPSQTVPQPSQPAPQPSRTAPQPTQPVPQPARGTQTGTKPVHLPPVLQVTWTPLYPQIHKLLSYLDFILIASGLILIGCCSLLSRT